jgi:hypothetical protein
MLKVLMMKSYRQLIHLQAELQVLPIKSVDLGDTQQSSDSGLLNNMRLVGTIIGKNKQIAVFSSPDGGAFKFEVGDLLTTSTVLLEIFSDVVIVKDQEDEKFEVYMNNIIRPSEG